MASKSPLWPPNGKFDEVRVTGVVDPDGDPVTLKITGLFQDERPTTGEEGSTCPDAVEGQNGWVRIRRERSGQGDGRVYHIRFRARDLKEAVCEGEVTVCVPHDQAADGCVDQGALFNSGVCRSERAFNLSPHPNTRRTNRRVEVLRGS